LRVRQFVDDHEGIVLPLASVVIFLLAWQLVVSLGIVSGFFFSSPLGVVDAGIEQVQTASFWNDVRISGVEFLVGYTLAVLVAVPFGLISGWYRRVGYAVEPWVNGLNATPRLALLPLVVLWAGVGQSATTVIVFIGVFFPVAINAFYGVRTVDRGLISVAESYGASEYTKFRTLILPSMVPFVLAGARLGIGRGVIGVVIGEFYSSTDGLGNFIFVSGSTLAVDNILFGALFITALALAAFTALGRFESRFQAWRPESEIAS
jgi:ABC-type nitrate/sulfonate/bicarbonate transport system permease component